MQMQVSSTGGVPYLGKSSIKIHFLNPLFRSGRGDMASATLREGGEGYASYKKPGSESRLAPRNLVVFWEDTEDSLYTEQTAW